MIQVLYEDNHLIAVNKPWGVLVQGDQTGDLTMADYVKQYIKDRYNKPGAVYLGIPHRLDRVVSGLVIYARTSKALERMNAMFREQEVEKTYYAVVEELPIEWKDTLVHYIEKDKAKNVSKAYDFQSNRAKNAKRSELSYEVLSNLGNHTVLKVNPKTGRPHQIRVQLSKVGMPIKDDVKYGYSKRNKREGIYLHCRSMAFMHPVKKERVEIFANTPDDQIWDNFSHLWED
ncbi:MAG: RluA family pseudouridine synthase [Saprospiraceae bacterium]|nr:RluA family pseudouridine synthase [Saprospiraceae bacterium]